MYIYKIKAKGKTKMILHNATFGKFKVVKAKDGDWEAWGIAPNGNHIGVVGIAPSSCRNEEEVFGFVKEYDNTTIIVE